jgi:flagellar biosynthesis protein FlhB
MPRDGDNRPFPPSPRRRALARQAGLVAASPVLTGAIACGAIVLVLAAGALAVAPLRAALTDICTNADPNTSHHNALGAGDVALAVLALVTPLLGAAALAALLAHLAQARALWLPRRRVEGAPAFDRGPAARTRGVAFDLLAATVIGAVAFAWLWLFAPRLAVLLELGGAAPGTAATTAGASSAAGTGAAAGGSSLLAAVAMLGVSALAAITIAWLAVGILDALARHLELARTLAMSREHKREDDRLAAADPRWARHRASFARDTAPQIEAAAVVLLGDDVAVAIAWDPLSRPIPTRLATGRRAHATQLVGLARRHRIAVHRDAELATSLADGTGPVPERVWPRLAEIIAAVRNRA